MAEPVYGRLARLGHLAGPARSREKVEAGADLSITLHRSIETSKGTKDGVSQALAAGFRSI